MSFLKSLFTKPKTTWVELHASHAFVDPRYGDPLLKSRKFLRLEYEAPQVEPDLEASLDSKTSPEEEAPAESSILSEDKVDEQVAKMATDVGTEPGTKYRILLADSAEKLEELAKLGKPPVFVSFRGNPEAICASHDLDVGDAEACYGLSLTLSGAFNYTSRVLLGFADAQQREEWMHVLGTLRITLTPVPTPPKVSILHEGLVYVQYIDRSTLSRIASPWGSLKRRQYWMRLFRPLHSTPSEVDGDDPKKPLSLSLWPSYQHTRTLPLSPRETFFFQGVEDEYVRELDESVNIEQKSEEGKSTTVKYDKFELQCRSRLGRRMASIKLSTQTLFKRASDDEDLNRRVAEEQAVWANHEVVLLCLLAPKRDVTKWCDELFRYGVLNIPRELEQRIQLFFSQEDLPPYPDPTPKTRNLRVYMLQQAAMGAVSLAGAKAKMALKIGRNVYKHGSMALLPIDEGVRETLSWYYARCKGRKRLLTNLMDRITDAFDNPNSAIRNYEAAFIESGVETPSIDSLQTLVAFLFLARVCYTEERGYIQMRSDSRDFTLLMSNTLSFACRPAFSLFLREREKMVVLAIRGSKSDQDWLTDVRATPERHVVEQAEQLTADCPTEFFCHAGFYNAAVWLKRILLPHLVRFRDMGYSVYLTGHSYGAAVSVILGLLAVSELPDLHVFTYSCPPCVDADFAEYLIEHQPQLITAVVHGNDVVPRLSVANFLRLDDDFRRAEEQAKKDAEHPLGIDLAALHESAKEAIAEVRDEPAGTESARPAPAEEKAPAGEKGVPVAGAARPEPLPLPPKPALPRKPSQASEKATDAVPVATVADTAADGAGGDAEDAVEMSTDEHKESKTDLVSALGPEADMVVPGRIVFLQDHHIMQQAAVIDFRHPVMRHIPFSSFMVQHHLAKTVHASLHDIIEMMLMAQNRIVVNLPSAHTTPAPSPAGDDAV